MLIQRYNSGIREFVKEETYKAVYKAIEKIETRGAMSIETFRRFLQALLSRSLFGRITVYDIDFTSHRTIWVCVSLEDINKEFNIDVQVDKDIEFHLK